MDGLPSIDDIHHPLSERSHGKDMDGTLQTRRPRHHASPQAMMDVLSP